jgi:hypothetical protein
LAPRRQHGAGWRRARQDAASVRAVDPEAKRLRERVLDSLRHPHPHSAQRGSTPRPPGTMVDRTGELGAEAMRVLNHEFMALVHDCYGQARERNPELRGMLALAVQFAAPKRSAASSSSSSPRRAISWSMRS